MTSFQAEDAPIDSGQVLGTSFPNSYNYNSNVDGGLGGLDSLPPDAVDPNAVGSIEGLDEEIGLANLGQEESENVLPSILIMGRRRSGKTSIRQVVFHKTSPADTMDTQMTQRVESEVCKNSFFRFKLYDFPGQIVDTPLFDWTAKFKEAGAVIFVIDSQEDHVEALSMLKFFVERAWSVNRELHFEIFIHKVDCLTDDTKLEVQRDIHNRILEDLSSFYDNSFNTPLSFHLTSIYDHSIFEAFSKVVQKLLPELPALEQLLDLFTRRSCLEKTFLFDMASKIFVASDSSVLDMQHYELCCDMIDAAIEMSSLYLMGAGAATAPFPPPADPSAAPNYGENQPDFYFSVLDSHFTTSIRLANNMVLYLRLINRHFGLACLIRAESFEKQGLIDYNLGCLRTAIEEVFMVRRVQARKLAQLQVAHASASDMHAVADTPTNPYANGDQSLIQAQSQAQSPVAMFHANQQGLVQGLHGASPALGVVRPLQPNFRQQQQQMQQVVQQFAGSFRDSAPVGQGQGQLYGQDPMHNVYDRKLYAQQQTNGSGQSFARNSPATNANRTSQSNNRAHL